jgi:hypothetical protein
MPSSSTSRPRGSYLPTLRLTLALLPFVLLSTGCPKRIVIPDPNQPHQIATDADVYVWCHGPEVETWTKCKVRASEGWWLASPQLVEVKD